MTDRLALDSAITVNTTLDPGNFFHTWSRVNSAADSLKDSVRAVKDDIGRAARGFARMAGSVKGVLAALMQTATVAQGLERGVMNLYRWSRLYYRTFSDSLNRLATDALYLKNSLAAMAAPLISSLSPAIDYITGRFVDLFNLINQVFARLTGSATYVAAKRTADAWDSVSGRITRATRAVRRYIMGFDELNLLGGAEGSGAGSGGSGGAAATMFEEREIGGGLADFVDSLKAALDASDWQALGTLIGEKVNGLVDGVDWAGVGSKVGFYLNGAIQTAYWLLDTVNFLSIGARIAELLNGALAEIDFSALGATVALAFTSLAETLAGFVGAFDWTQLAAKAAEAVNGFASTLGERLDAVDWADLALRLTGGLNTLIRDADWALIGRTFGWRINDLLDILGTAAESFDWRAAGEALAEAVNRLFGTIDWEALGRWLNRSVQGVLDFGIALLEGFDAEGFAGGVGRALEQVDWSAIAAKLWKLLETALLKLGDVARALLFGGEANLNVGVGLVRSGWTSIGGFVGTAVTVLTSLGKSGWTSIGGFVGTAVTVLTSLGKNGWTSIAKYVGTAVTVATKLSRNGWSTIAKFVGTAVTVLTKLKKNGWTSIAKYVGSSVTVATSLRKSGWDSVLKYITGNKEGSVAIKLTLNSVASALKTAASKLGITLATGGVVTAAGNVRRFASGGVIRGGTVRYLSEVPHYASGTSRAHGTVFVAGEAGPEIVGHVNGRTEILNKSQLAQAIYGAVVAGMAQAVNALGAYLGNRMAECANAIVETVGSLGSAGEIAALRGLEFRAPAMAGGSVLPYEAAARAARAAEDLQDALDANNEDLIQTIISVIGAQTSAIVAALRANQQTGAGSAGGVTARQLIDQINRQTQMFGASPLAGG